MQRWVMYFSGLAKIFALRIILTLARKKVSCYFILFGGGSWFPANKRQGIWIFGPQVIFGKIVK